MSSEEFDSASKTGAEKFFEKVANGDIPLDGAMSPLTRELVKKFQADGVDMTIGWVCTARNWICPSCDRAKSEIVRLNSKKQLMCRLVEHHDHMKDLVEKAFKRACRYQVVLQADLQAKRFAERASSMVSAYDNTLICDDCNVADAIAKKAANSNVNFSYSPQEIRKFVLPRANLPHEIDVKVAEEIWLENEKTFAIRLKIIDDIAEIAATDTHWYQELPIYQRAEYVFGSAESIATRHGGIQYLEQLAGKKNALISEDVSSWRFKIQSKQNSRPSTKDIEYVAKVISSQDWNSVAEDWKCPTCKRTKLQTIRKSKKDWIFLLAERNFYESTSRNKSKRERVCSECAAIAMNIGSEASRIAGLKYDQNYAKYIQLSELEKIIRPQPYGRHNLSNELVDSLMEEIVERVHELNKASTSWVGHPLQDDAS